MADKKYDDTNSGALFVNDKQGNEKRPDLTGKLFLKVDDFSPDADGNVLVYIAGWKRESDKHGEIISLKASPPKK